MPPLKTLIATLAGLGLVAQGAAAQAAPDTARVRRCAIFEVFVRDFSPSSPHEGRARD